MEKSNHRTSILAIASKSKISDWTILLTLIVLVTIVFRDFVFSNDMLYGSDTLSLGYMAREFYANLIQEGMFPLWNPFILGGTPFLESLAGGDSLYPPSLLLLMVLEPHRALGWKLIIHIVLAGYFMYKWIQSLELSDRSAFCAAVAYSLSPVMVSLVHGGQDGKIFVIALTPLLFWRTESFSNYPSVRNFSLLSIVIGSIILTTHFQMAYFLFIGTGVYFITKLFMSTPQEGSKAGQSFLAGRIKFSLVYGLSALLGLALSAVQFFPATSYVVDLSRRTSTTVEATAIENRSYSGSWSLHPEEIMGLAVPEFVGVTNGNEPWTQNTYWGRNGFKGNHEYLGIAVLLLAGVGLFNRRNKYLKGYMLSMGLVAMLFALGEHTPLWGLFYEWVPGIPLFRAPSLSIFLTTFSAITLMALGLEDLFTLSDAKSHQSKWKRMSKFLFAMWLLMFCGFFFARSGMLSDFWTTIFYEDISETAKEILRSSQVFITRGFLFSLMVLSGLLAVLVALRKKYLSLQLSFILIIFILSFDFVRVNSAFISTVDFQSFRTPSESTKTLVEQQRKETPFRVLSLAGLNGQDVRPGMFGLELAGGHHPNDIGRYRDLIGMKGSGLPINLITNPNVLKLLNVRYVLWPNQLGKPSDQGLPETIVDNLTLFPGSDTDDIYAESIYVFPTLERARLVSDPVVIPDETEALAFILSDQFDPSTQLVVDELPEMAISSEVPGGSISWVSREVNRMELEVTTPSNSFLVLSDNWSPGWKSQVDGIEVDVLRVNHSLRGIPIQAGNHSVIVYYHSTLLTWSLMGTLITFVSLVFLVVANPEVMNRRLKVRAEGLEP